MIPRGNRSGIFTTDQVFGTSLMELRSIGIARWNLEGLGKYWRMGGTALVGKRPGMRDFAMGIVFKWKEENSNRNCVLFWV